MFQLIANNIPSLEEKLESRVLQARSDRDILI